MPKNIHIRPVFLILLLTIAHRLLPQGPPPDPTCPIPPCVPINYHIEFLIIAGITLACFTIYKHSKKPTLR